MTTGHTTTPPLRQLGILGAGQLGQMLGLAAAPLGVRCRFVDPAQGAPASLIGEQLPAAYGSSQAASFLSASEVVSYEFENVPVDAVQSLSTAARPVHPGAVALQVSQDRLAEKTHCQKLGIPTAPYRAVNTQQQLEAAVAELGLPALLKTRRFGYDGKGQKLLRSADDVAGAVAELAPQAAGGKAPAPAEAGLILEGYVSFRRELSIVAARGRGGEVRFYPLVENDHAAGMLYVTRAPAARVSPDTQRSAEGHARRLLEALDYVGVMALELFEVDDASGGVRLLANEIAPRVHNSGHWSIEGARTSQFENHVRAVLGLPLGDPEALGPCAMVNIIGQEPAPAAVLAIPDAHLHRYGKAPRPRRKLGHVTVRAPDRVTLEARLAELTALIPAPSRAP